jgi:hypothetical protein
MAGLDHNKSGFQRTMLILPSLQQIKVTAIFFKYIWFEMSSVDLFHSNPLCSYPNSQIYTQFNEEISSNKWLKMTEIINNYLN